MENQIIVLVAKLKLLEGSSVSCQVSRNMFCFSFTKILTLFKHDNNNKMIELDFKSDSESFNEFSIYTDNITRIYFDGLCKDFESSEIVIETTNCIIVIN